MRTPGKSATVIDLRFHGCLAVMSPRFSHGRLHFRLRRLNLRITRLQGQDDDHRRHRDVGIRPNRPGPNTDEGHLEIDDIRESQNFVR